MVKGQRVNLVVGSWPGDNRTIQHTSALDTSTNKEEIPKIKAQLAMREPIHSFIYSQ